MYHSLFQKMLFPEMSFILKTARIDLSAYSEHIWVAVFRYGLLQVSLPCSLYYNERRNIGRKIIRVDVMKLIISMHFLNLKTDYGKSERTKEDGTVKSNV